MAAPKRSEAQREVDLVEIEELALEGKSDTEIAAILSGKRPYTLTRQQIDYDLEQLREDWKSERFTKVEEAKGRALAKIRRLEREAWKAWHRSQQDATTKSVKKVKNTGAAGRKGKAPSLAQQQEEQLRIEAQVGDPRYFGTVQWCIAEEAKITGILAPLKVTPTKPDGSPIDPVEKTDDQLRATLTELAGVLLANASGAAIQGGPEPTPPNDPDGEEEK